MSQISENLVKKLEQSLADIEEIEGALKIVRSYSLISLTFFKKLRVIHGINTQENYALYVMDNQNLQSLFDKPVIIERGKVFFHFNSKLCYATIEKIKSDVHDMRSVERFAIEDVAINSNGDKVACKYFLYNALWNWVRCAVKCSHTAYKCHFNNLRSLMSLPRQCYKINS